MRKTICAVLCAVLLLAGCRSVPGIVDVTAPPLPTATVLPTSTPMTIAASDAWDLSLYNDWVLDLTENSQGSFVLCAPALAASVHSLYWAGEAEAQGQLEAILGVPCTRQNQCVNTSRILQELQEKNPGLDLWFRMHVGSGIALNETNLGIFPEYFEAQLELADLTDESWSRDLQEQMALATGGRLSQDLSDHAAHGTDSVLLSCSAFDVRFAEVFDPARDKVESFAAADGQMTSVNTMRSFSDHRIFRAQAGTMAVLDMENDLELWAILPREGEGVSQLLSQCDMQEFIRWRSLAEETEMGVALPQVDMEVTHDLTAALRNMGLTTLTDAKGQYDTIGRDFSGVDTVLSCSHLRFLHELAQDAPEPTATAQSQLITRPREPEMLVFNRECLMLVVEPSCRGILYAVALRTV